ncbi:Nuclear aminoacylation-dependent tRNA export pathway component [Coemansia spiralis]|uniref:Nuclear aminoacylation-dependent tRNA export pathway component n=2 Tax=Coemansia TaxID=4863 RepID=A0A9W8GCT3_9FUNG|nr:Nuclear aminoacylation-dependent tRNA export pathway component [Coemansia umbellata]KAJ2624186.1 Nuclear aminoacylation-dependent tRNA export pathway component [Coemansia sp. RSA 1358]KAJ2680777.1 Nuclear aminoacylation-dependent tRNA export pathway component [Coemansia spiralis]
MSGLSSYFFSTLSKVGGIGGSGLPDFHFTIGNKLEGNLGTSIWELHNARSTDGKKEATVFVFDKLKGPSYTIVAQNALKRMRTLRHPGILRYLEGTETADAIYIATESITPLPFALDEGNCDDELKRWGIYKIAETLRFVNDDCKLVHANVCTSSVFVTKAGEWRLSGLELVDALDGDGASSQIYRHYTGAIPGYAAHMAPELESQSWDSIEKGKPGAVDGWGLACLIYQVYNDSLSSTSQLHSQGQIPASLWPMYQRLLTPDLRRRLTPGELLQSALRPRAFLDSNFVKTSIFLENIAVKEESEKVEFFAGLDSMIEGFPHAYCKYKILPELLKIMEFGGGDAKVLSSIIQIGRGLDESEYNDLVSPAIVQLFGSNDRALRFSLLEHIGSFIKAIPTNVVSKQVFPNFVTGFLDAAPAIREATVKASLAIAPKLGQKVLNNDLIKQLVRMVADPEPGIRTNALICIGKLCTAKPGVLDLEDGGVNEASQRYVICPALLQALRDPFPPVRSASLAVATACAPKWEAVDVARRVIPAVAHSLIDGEKPVRAAAFKAMNAMISRVDAHAQAMPDTAAKKAPSNPTLTSSPTAGKSSGAVSPGSAASMSAQTEAAANMASASDGWSGWAVSSLSSTISGALSLASSLPLGQQQQTKTPSESPISSTTAHQDLEKSNTTSIEAAKPKASTALGSTSVVSAANKVSGGWEFNDDWGNDDEDVAGDDSWDVNDNWDTDVTATAKITSPALISPTTPVANNFAFGQGAGGMATSNSANTPISPTSMAQVSLTKTPLKLSKPGAKKPGLTSNSNSNSNASAANASATGSQRRKGLGAMKLGGASKTPALPDDFF